jgi:hypothetical protein
MASVPSVRGDVLVEKPGLTLFVTTVLSPLGELVIAARERRLSVFSGLRMSGRAPSIG